MSEVSWKRGIVLVLAIVGLSGIGTKASADADVKFSTWLKEVRTSGDFRLRHEIFDKRTPGQVDRTRERFRWRHNMEFVLPNNLSLKTTLASGAGEQVSTNQSFDNLSGQKDIWIDRVYVVWTPLAGFYAQAGRMANPFWTQYSSDAVWDGDFNPEGFAQGYSRLIGPVNIFVNALQMIVDEDSGNNVGTAASGQQADQWMMGEQIGVEFRLPLETRAKIAYANYDWKHERRGTFGQATVNEGNTDTTGGARTAADALNNNFNVDEFSGQLSGWVFRIPLVLQGTYVKNRGAREDAAYTPKDEDTGWQAGGILGKAGTKGKWEGAYFRKHVRSDATVADIADSDFGDGGTNREGHIFWLAYSPVDFVTAQIKYFETKVINATAATSPGGPDDIRRAQFDISFKY